MEHLSPFRYPGWKSKVADYFKLVYTENDIEGRVYVEPYVGELQLHSHFFFTIICQS